MTPSLSKAQKKEALDWALVYEAKMEAILKDKTLDSPWQFLQATLTLLETDN